MYDDVTYVYDDVTYVYDDVTYVQRSNRDTRHTLQPADDVTYVYDDVTYVYDDVTTQQQRHTTHSSASATPGAPVPKPSS